MAQFWEQVCPEDVVVVEPEVLVVVVSEPAHTLLQSVNVL
jgi:hypothetical protein